MSEALGFTAKIGEDGSPEFDEPQRFSQYLKGLAGKRVRFEIRLFRAGRTLSQNRKLWAGVYGEIVAQLFYKADNELSPEDLHEYCKQRFCPTTSIPLPGGGTGKIRSTRRLNTEQMAEYIERVMDHFADYGVEFQ